MTTLIIGGGWSGFAAAITLVQHGHTVHLIESAKQPGGRARNIKWRNTTIDNGQHLMIGAYSRMLAMMKYIGIDIGSAFQRLPLNITIYDTRLPPLKLSTKGYLPWPASLAWNLVCSAGLSGLLSVARLQSDIPTLLAQNDITVSNWLHKVKQPDHLIRQLWEPLCLATLNTPIAEASAHILATVLQDSLGKDNMSSDLLIPRPALGNLFPCAAVSYIEQYGNRIDLQTRAKNIVIKNNKVHLVKLNDGRELSVDNIIVAVSSSQLVRLLLPHINIAVPAEHPIYTIYLQYPNNICLPAPIIGMTGTISQWVFDANAKSPGLIAVVISGHGSHERMPKARLIQQVCDELHQTLPLPKTAQDSLLVCEKRATFACTIDIEKTRPVCKTDIDGLWLAGDFVANGYPATLEGAIRNGENCAKQLLQST